MNSKKINYSIINSIIIIINIVLLCISNTVNKKSLSLINNIQFISIIAILLFIYITVSWKSINKRLLSPYYAFFVMLFICTCGQVFLWAFNLSAGFRDLKIWYNSRYTSWEICNGLIFSLLCVTFLHFIVCIEKKNEDKQSREIITINQRNTYNKIVVLGMAFTIIFFVPYFLNWKSSYHIISIYGYDAQYDLVLYGISSIFSKLSSFFPVGILTLLFVWGKKDEFNKNNYLLKKIFLIFICLVYFAFELSLGQRTSIILFLLAFIFIRYKNSKIPVKKIIIYCIIGIALMAFMRVINIVRSGENISSYKSNNFVVDFVGDAGWNLMSLIEFTKLIPAKLQFSKGFSYVISLTELIPNLNFWSVHPAYEYGNISNVIRETLGFNFGFGCTPVAEAYYNFGYFGFIIFYFWGKIISIIDEKYKSLRFVDNYFSILFIGILLKSCVRSSFFSVFRPFIIFILIPTFLIKFYLKENITNKKEVKV